MDKPLSESTGLTWKRLAPATLAWLFLFLVISTLAIVLRWTEPPVTARTPDENMYIYYARQVSQFGENGARLIVGNFNHNTELWIYPSPVRFGYIYLVAGFMKLFHASAEKAADSLSLGFSMVAFFVTALFGLRFFNRWATLIGLALLAVNPLDLATAQRA